MNYNIHKVIPTMKKMNPMIFKLYTIITFLTPTLDFYLSINQNKFITPKVLNLISTINPSIDPKLISVDEFNFIFQNMLSVSFGLTFLFYSLLMPFFYREKKWAVKMIHYFIIFHLFFLFISMILSFTSSLKQASIHALFCYMHLIVIFNFKYFFKIKKVD
jgi:hypothetical protein